MKKFKPSIPDPLILALGLTGITLILALIFGTTLRPGAAGLLDVLICWTEGFWDLLAFSMQMVLILLLGYMLALSPALDRLSSRLSILSSHPVPGTVILTIIALILGLLNWGLALVFGAILVKKIAEQASRSHRAINYALLGASAYVCMMVWHGGLSGSAPLSVADQGHFMMDATGIIPLSATIFSPMNLAVSGALLISIPLASWFFAKKHPGQVPDLLPTDNESCKNTQCEKHAEMPMTGKLPEDLPNTKRSVLLPVFGALLLAGFLIYTFTDSDRTLGLNQINTILFALVLMAFPNADKLGSAAANAVSSTTGIIIQFPLYAGIMGIMRYSGLLAVITNWFVSISTPQTLPLFSFLSASLVNLFVPSGGGQWAVQGPILIEAAGLVGVDYAKQVMALAYGDQLTNMMQPFWALPLLGITGLKAGQILKYSLPFMLIGGTIYSLALIFF
ncbi:MAG: Short-chain fatty acids transporter [Bacteroidetes bacterium ADurb.Bin037]|nr:MAG: Short-chain fatty acids transporter [Bacteroidetes bacterium ADurb.Bin037]HPW79161.1 TIGR00366 family protein [Bacteroidales bacterium]